MNGQPIRQQIVHDLAEDLVGDVQLVIETGTFRGFSTGFLQRTFRCPIWTVESNPRWYAYVRARFALNRHVKVWHSDSREFLQRAAGQADADALVFAYLDAHWEEDLPLREELAIIADTWQRVAIMIDDFEVPDDPGYRFDDYGPGKALTADYLSTSAVADWPRFYPSAPSSAEGGAVRGCCLLISPSLVPVKLRGLRPSRV